MNISYCGKQCTIGVEKSKKLLEEQNSAYDAAMDFMWFVEDCLKTCPYKECHNLQEAKLR